MEVFETFYNADGRPDAAQRAMLAARTGLDSEYIYNWFNNYAQKMRPPKPKGVSRQVPEETSPPVHLYRLEDLYSTHE
ncbi:hypothetical protein K466DRAFT_592557 [Polyporus arcularius HHB13444]|uniref:Homeobox domain-containing protein n=1 Tax=Polyporus arcularius HHB13444 TaxID=1314778 RepID=A0A5C3NPY7_9APHY|nr:hypothetical protein K466DRAFT_592557 [Polyporus arcularius HHB13444]